MTTTPGYLGKARDEWLRRHLNRRLSRPITLWLVKTPVTPNQISTFTFLLSIFSGWLVSGGDSGAIRIGGFLFWFGSVLDCVDGEIARLKNLSSKFGEVWDKICDKVGVLAFLGGVVLGVYRQGRIPDLIPLAVEAVVVVGLVMILGETLVSLYRRWAPPEIVAAHQNVTLYLKHCSSPFLCRLFRFVVPLMRREFVALTFMTFSLLNRLDGLLVLIFLGIHLLLLLDLFFLGRLAWQKARNHW